MSGYKKFTDYQGLGIGSMATQAIVEKVVTVCCIVSIIAAIGYAVKAWIDSLTLKENSVGLGGDCKESFQCIGYKEGDGPACCYNAVLKKKTCVLKVKDSWDKWWCPNELGTVEVGWPCETSVQCIGYKTGDGPACCFDPVTKRKTCTNKVKDASYNWWCPNEAILTPGSVALDKSCRESSECAGYTFGGLAGNVACCQNKCLKLMKDHAGHWYCPHECVGTLFGKPGTCK